MGCSQSDGDQMEAAADPPESLAGLHTRRLDWALPGAEAACSVEVQPDSLPGDDLSTPPAAMDPCELLERRQVAGALHDALEELHAGEADFIRCRFGLGDEGPMTLDEVSARFGLRPQMARRVESAALARLRSSLRVRALYGGSSATVLTRSRRGALGGQATATYCAVGTATAARPVTVDSASCTLEAAFNLAHAEAISVVDERMVGGRLWVQVTSPATDGQLLLVDRLWRLGFDFWPGRGYCL